MKIAYHILLSALILVCILAPFGNALSAIEACSDVDVFFASGISNLDESTVDYHIDQLSNCIQSNEFSDRGAAYIHALRGLLYDKKKLNKKAIEDFTVSIDLDSKNNGLHYLRGKSYLQDENYLAGRDDLEKYLLSDPENASVHAMISLTYKEYGKYDKALSHLDKSIAIDSDNYHAYLQRGFCYYHKKEWGRAIDEFTKTISINPEAELAYRYRGYSYTKIGEEEKAKKDSDKYFSFLLKDVREIDVEAILRKDVNAE